MYIDSIIKRCDSRWVVSVSERRCNRERISGQSGAEAFGSVWGKLQLTGLRAKEFWGTAAGCQYDAYLAQSAPRTDQVLSETLLFWGKRGEDEAGEDGEHTISCTEYTLPPTSSCLQVLPERRSRVQPFRVVARRGKLEGQAGKQTSSTVMFVRQIVAVWNTPFVALKSLGREAVPSQHSHSSALLDRLPPCPALRASPATCSN